MESQFKPGFDGTQGVASRGRNVSTTAPSSPMQLPGFILRAVAIVLTFIAAIVMGVAKETKTIVVTDPTTMASETLTGTAKSGYSSTLVYFIVVNVIAFLYSAISLAISIANRAGSRNLELPFSIADLVTLLLLFSSNSAATAENGNSHLGWVKICDSVGKFCTHVTASLVLSMFASMAYLSLVLLAIFGLYKRSQ